MKDLGIYNAYRVMKRRQSLIDEAIDRDFSPKAQGDTIDNGINPEQFNKYNELVKKLQVKTNQDGSKS